MDTIQVIKVKHNGGMCRIAASMISGNGGAISLAALEDRIRASFRLPKNASLVMTYVDSDGDVINLSSDEDIVDALDYQKLNPLRVDLSVVEAAASGVDKGASKTAASGSGAAPADAPTDAAASAKADEKKEDDDKEKVVKELADHVEKQLKEALGVTEDVGKMLGQFGPLLKTAPANIAKVLATALQSGLSVSFEPVFEHGRSSCTGPNAFSVAAETVEKKEEKEPAAKVASSEDPAAGSNKSADAAGLAAKPVGDGESAAAAIAGLIDTVACAAAAASAAAATAAKAAESAADKALPATSADAAKAVPPGESAQYPVVHMGIICDGCEMNPLVGPRFKSLKQHDYDLCEQCFTSKQQLPEDYQRMDVPAYRPLHRQHFRGPAWASPCQPGGRPMRFAPPPGCRGPSSSPFVPPHLRQAASSFAASHGIDKLDGRFVKDVTVPDGMEMAPGTKFVKMWRIRNSGGVAWPQYTQIVHIGGDALGERSACPLHLPQDGVQPGHEVDVAVDMVCPSKPGRYVSHWRLCAPGGPRFGHRVWALVHVVKPGSPSPQVSISLGQSSVAEAAGIVQTPAAAAGDETLDAEAPAGTPAASGAEEEIAAILGRTPAEAPPAKDLPAPSAPVAEAETHAQSAPVDPVIAAVAAALPPAAVEEPLAERVVPTAPPAPATSFILTEANKDGFVEVPSAPLPAAAAAGAPQAPASVQEAHAPTVTYPVPGVVSGSDTGSVDGYVDVAAALNNGEFPTGGSASGSSSSVSSGSSSGSSAAAAAAAKAARDVMFDEVKVEDVTGEDAELMVMLDQLDGMGFEDRTLNKEVLLKAKRNVFAAVEMLMHTAEWDPMLDDLKEMGFTDERLNKRMMFKNDGNSKATVKDLIKFYTRPSESA